MNNLKDHKIFENIIDGINICIMSDLESLCIIFDSKDEFQSLYEYEKRNLPYHINLLDEIRVSENAHSRIFVKLLKYSDRGKYELLESFFNYLNFPFSELEIVDPKITAEIGRIDIRIRDRSYTVIIENKVSGAGDQPGQIERYIKKEIDSDYEEENIYILYLTFQGGSPKEISIPMERRQVFGARYKEINYRNHIWPWLINELKRYSNDTDSRAKETTIIMKSGIIQYKDYFDGLFFERKGMEKMNNAMIRLVTTKLNLESDENTIDKLNRIDDYIKYTENMKTVLENAKGELLYFRLKEFENELCKQRIMGIIEIMPNNEGRFGEKDSLIKFIPYGWNKRFCIGVAFDKNLSGLYYGIYDVYGQSDNKISDRIQKYLKDSGDTNEYWPYWRYLIKGDDAIELVNQIEEGILTNFIKENITELIDKSKEITLLIDKRL